MRDYEENFYNYPAKSGLEIVGVLEYSSGSYEFDTLVVFNHLETGVLYAARDSGCSCPTPFEDFDTLDDMKRIDDYMEFRREVLAEKSEYLSPGDVLEFLDKVHEAYSL